MITSQIAGVYPKPLVTIVTPTFNQSEFLAETIESVLAQDYENIEYIVINDGSTDNTPQILLKYSGRLRMYSQENMGQASTLNRGWTLASGKYIGYLSSDDVLYQGTVSKLVRALEADSQTVAVFPDADSIDFSSRAFKKNVCRPFDYDHLVVSQECFIGPGALFHKSAYERVGGWRPDLRRTPDREFWMRLGGLGKIVFVADALAGYRLHPESTSFREDNPDEAMEYVQVTEAFFAGANVPEHLRTRRAEAMGFAYLMVARSCFRSGHLRRGITALRIAGSYSPKVRSPQMLLRTLRSIIGRPVRRMIWGLKSAIGKR